MSVRATARFTRDVDIVVAVSGDAEAEALCRSLLGEGYRVLAQLEQEETNRLATVRLVSPGDAAGVIVDLLFASCGIEPEIVAAAEQIALEPGLTVPVARREHLIAMKVLARNDRRRPQDYDDLRSMIARATPEEMARARDAIALIQTRGAHRGKDLAAEFDSLLAELRSAGP